MFQSISGYYTPSQCNDKSSGGPPPLRAHRTASKSTIYPILPQLAVDTTQTVGRSKRPSQLTMVLSTRVCIHTHTTTRPWSPLRVQCLTTNRKSRHRPSTPILCAKWTPFRQFQSTKSTLIVIYCGSSQCYNFGYTCNMESNHRI